jgi:hypothetical protein
MIQEENKEPSIKDIFDLIKTKKSIIYNIQKEGQYMVEIYLYPIFDYEKESLYEKRKLITALLNELIRYDKLFDTSKKTLESLQTNYGNEEFVGIYTNIHEWSKKIDDLGNLFRNFIDEIMTNSSSQISSNLDVLIKQLIT